jgi:molecular chaperone GrpE
MTDIQNELMEPASQASPDKNSKVIELERYLRLAADFENYKKRVNRDREREAGAQKVALVSDLLPIVDNLERSLAVQTSGEFPDGIKMVLDLFITVLKRHGFEPREDLGSPFDGRFHDAIAVGQNPEFPPMAIIEVWQRGWMRGEKMFRPAKVLVNDSTTAANESVGTPFQFSLPVQNGSAP